MIEKFEAMLESGQDSAGLRFALATLYLKDGQPEPAVRHAEAAVAQDAGYSAAWRLLGQAQVTAGEPEAAAATFERGIEIARAAGDRQVEKEMAVFLRRIQRSKEKSSP